MNRTRGESASVFNGFAHGFLSAINQAILMDLSRQMLSGERVTIIGAVNTQEAVVVGSVPGWSYLPWGRAGFEASHPITPGAMKKSAAMYVS